MLEDDVLMAQLREIHQGKADIAADAKAGDLARCDTKQVDLDADAVTNVRLLVVLLRRMLDGDALSEQLLEIQQAGQLLSFFKGCITAANVDNLGAFVAMQVCLNKEDAQAFARLFCRMLNGDVVLEQLVEIQQPRQLLSFVKAGITDANADDLGPFDAEQVGLDVGAVDNLQLYRALVAEEKEEEEEYLAQWTADHPGVAIDPYLQRAGRHPALSVVNENSDLPLLMAIRDGNFQEVITLLAQDETEVPPYYEEMRKWLADIGALKELPRFICKNVHPDEIDHLSISEYRTLGLDNPARFKEQEQHWPRKIKPWRTFNFRTEPRSVHVGTSFKDDWEVALVLNRMTPASTPTRSSFRTKKKSRPQRWPSGRSTCSRRTTAVAICDSHFQLYPPLPCVRSPSSFFWFPSFTSTCAALLLRFLVAFRHPCHSVACPPPHDIS